MKKILLIEDSTAIRNCFSKLLNERGFCTIVAENGLAGIDRAQEHLPDLIICDIVMPQLDGYGVLTTLRQDPVTTTIPFIFLTAKTTQNDVRKGMEMGADDYITKPCKVDELLRAIATQFQKYPVSQQSQATTPYPSTSKTSAAEVAPTHLDPSSILPSLPQFSEIFDFIEANYHQSITLNDVAKAVGYSKGYLTEIVRSQTGCTINRWIVERRMAEVRALLLKSDRSMEEIAQEVGYQSLCHFFRQFRQHHGKTPQAWKKEQQNQFITQVNRNNC